MKKLSLLLLMSFSLNMLASSTESEAESGAVERSSMINVDIACEPVYIPEYIMACKDGISLINQALKNDSLKDILAAMSIGDTTTYSVLASALRVLNDVLKDCADESLENLKSGFKEMQQIVESQDLSLFVDSESVTRKKCCCVNQSCGNFTVNGSLTAYGNITVSGSGRAFIVGGARILSGSGSPNGSLSAPKGSLYLNLTGSSDSTRAFINTNGGTAWTAITTAD